MAPASKSPAPNAPSRNPRVVVIGAGMSGILSAIKLQQAGFDQFVVYEKANRLGGTWRENTYAGIACDVPSHFYSYSFALNPEWTQRFSPGQEIQSYFEEIAQRFGVDARIEYGKQVKSCVFREDRWRIEIDDGSKDEADFIIAATGVLHHPSIPDFPGRDSFAGPAFHSARWDPNVSLADKRVGIIGTGSSAIQMVSALADKVPALTLFQRTPQWVAPAENPPYTEEEKAHFRANPEAMETIREEFARTMTDAFANVLVDADSPMLKLIHDNCVANLENSVTDPELREKLRPDYRAACKRLIMSPNFYEAIQHPNAQLVTEGIEGIEPGGVQTIDGRLHELDVLIFATGFQVDSFVRPMEVRGRTGTLLDAVWKDGPSAYMAISVPDFPNFFLLNGPNSPVGNFSLIDVAERQFDYVMQLLEMVRSGQCTGLSASGQAMDEFDRLRKKAARNTIWNSGCKSWYLDGDGLPTAWPWTYDKFREEMSNPRLEDYEIH
ncbi:MAG TPA: NAD(P)/FAD-dependent oxidoreductase [Myxococcales bacterium]|nr:NAD(P)/FAD-dependent oxidoreductase [Myxococcales bacterium]